MAIAPNLFITQLYGKGVTVKTNAGLSFTDGNMNLALTDCKEYFHGEEKKTYKSAFIRGNNVLYINEGISSNAF
ncbi:U4/U6-U5 snRNP complex subunit lsm6 [Mitosporidium daphniae]